MFAIKKVNDEKKFRKDMFKSKRKELSEVFTGNYFKEVINIARFAPSACNTQPWKAVSEKNKLTVYRYKKPGKRGIMPADKVAYYNRIDIGIFLLFLRMHRSGNRPGLYFYLPMIGAFGGFLFHMIWEANSRYIFLYWLLIFPYASKGLFDLYEFTVPFLNRFFSKNSKVETEMPSSADTHI